MPWGEKVHYIAGGGKMKPAGPGPKWQEGIFLGLVDKSNEYIIGTPQGCVRSNNAKRQDSRDASDAILFASVTGTPWRMNHTIGQAQDDLPVRPVVVRAAAVGPTELPPKVEPEVIGPRRVYIRKEVELQRYGYTPTCKGCEAAKTDKGSQSHTDECRGRIERAMAADPKLSGRVMAAEVRRVDAEAGDAAPTPASAGVGGPAAHPPLETTSI